LRHKATQRALYNDARAALPDGVDELLFINERDEVCEGTITNIAALIDGVWQTPPLSSGCLPGTYRQHLLNEGKVEEAVLTEEDLRRASKVILMNALRGEIAAEITRLA
jgi:4-amino-4-deoxychorismate lyase